VLDLRSPLRESRWNAGRAGPPDGVTTGSSTAGLGSSSLATSREHLRRDPHGQPRALADEVTDESRSGGNAACADCHLAHALRCNLRRRRRILSTKLLVGVLMADSSVPSCSVCASALTPGALKCSACGSYQERCAFCGLPIPPMAEICTECNVYKNGVRCRSCRASMPRDATRCSTCNAFQGARRFFPGTETALALVVALISVLTGGAAVIYHTWTFRSITTALFLGERDSQNGKVLTLAVANDGSRSATLGDSVYLDWDEDIPFGRAQLKILNPESRIILPGKTALIDLTAAGIPWRKQPVSKSVTTAALAKCDVIVSGTIAQTDWFGDHPNTPFTARIGGYAVEDYLEQNERVVYPGN